MATSTQTSATQNGVNGIMSSPDQDKGASSDEEGRCHTSSSVSKTKPSLQLLQSTIDDMDDVKQKIDFTDTDHQDHHLSSLSPPPSSKAEVSGNVAFSAPPSLNSSRKEENEKSSEQAPDIAEQKASVEAILDRLETVRNYTEDARSLYQQLEAHEDEAGNTEQMERVSVLIGQLKQQELSYLQVLLKLMEGENIDDGQFGQLEQLLNKEQQQTDDEEGEEEEESDDEGVEEGTGSNDSMSLRAEMNKGSGEEEELVEQQREIEALHEQRALLIRLQEQQSQLEALKSRQAHLLKLKQEAEERLSETEKQCDELGNVSQDYSRDGNDSLMMVEENDAATEREKILMSELEQLRVKKKQAEKLMEELSITKETPPESASVHIDSAMKRSPPRDELVDSNLQELQFKLKQIEEARHKMKELQEMVGMLQGMTLAKQSPSKEELTKRGNRKPQAPPTVDNLDESQDDEVIHLLADYEQNIGKRQRELEDIKKRKEDLKQVEKMLQDIQLMTEKKRTSSSVHYDNEREGDSSEDEEIVGSRLSSELSKQQQLYTDLKRKTQQLKQLQQEIEKFSRGSDHESAMADTTIATWGGSSVTSVLSAALEEETREGPENIDPNLPQYHVDRHTPRHPRPLRRAYSPHDDQDTTIGKKIKLEPQTSLNRNSPTTKRTGPTGSTQQQQQTPSVNKRSAIWPSVIFSQSANRSTSVAGKVQTPPSFSRPKVGTPAPVTTAPSSSAVVPNDYTQLLQQQLSNSSAMCFQLMEHQSSLLLALNQKLDTLPHIHEQMLQLHEYHDHLQGYHEYLNNAYWQLMEYPKDQQEVGQEGLGEENGNEQEVDTRDTSTNGSPVKQKQQSFINPDPFSSSLGLLPPPHPLNLPTIVNSPYQRPRNPHLQASPDTKHLRPFTRPPSGYPYSLYGNSIPPTHIPEVMQEVMATTNQETQCDGMMESNHIPLESESVSSLPDRPPTDNGASLSEGVTVFEKLRDTIYSEVASLIASNEDRPHFLVELFRELQLLNTDYLRQRALYSIQDLVTRFLKVEDETPEDNQDDQSNDNDEEGLPDNIYLSSIANHRSNTSITKRGNSQRFDYVEVIESASSISTPPLNEEPFASDVLGDTVIKTNKVDQLSDTELDTTLLDNEIKSIMTNVIPLLKSHLSEECDTTTLDTVRSAIIDMVLLKEDLKGEGDLGAVFIEQLQASLINSIEKYRGKLLKDCGEDLLVDVSEVLFNEIAFYRLIRGTRGMTGKDYYQSVTSGSQTTTDLESITNSPQRPVVSSLVLQSLGSVISRTLQEESESLGNNRDDDLAQAWEPKKQEDKQIESDTKDVIITEESQEEQQKKKEDDIVENGYVKVPISSDSSGPVDGLNPPNNPENTKESNQAT